MPAAHTPPATQPLKNSVRLNGTGHHALKNWNEDDCKENQSKTSHKLLHALRLRTVGIEKSYAKTDTASYIFTKAPIKPLKNGTK